MNWVNIVTQETTVPVQIAGCSIHLPTRGSCCCTTGDSCQYPFIENGGLMIGTLEGTMRADPLDWIIKGVNGEFYPCKPDVFASTYEEVVE